MNSCKMLGTKAFDDSSGMLTTTSVSIPSTPRCERSYNAYRFRCFSMSSSLTVKTVESHSSAATTPTAKLANYDRNIENASVSDAITDERYEHAFNTNITETSIGFGIGNDQTSVCGHSTLLAAKSRPFSQN
jgi:hypothetical protein